MSLNELGTTARRTTSSLAKHMQASNMFAGHTHVLHGSRSATLSGPHGRSALVRALAKGTQQPGQPPRDPLQPQQLQQQEDVVELLRDLKGRVSSVQSSQGVLDSKMSAMQLSAQESNAKLNKKLSAINKSNSRLYNRYGGINEDACRVKLAPLVGLSAVTRSELRTLSDWLQRAVDALQAAGISMAAAQSAVAKALIAREEMARSAAAQVVLRLQSGVRKLKHGTDSEKMAPAALAMMDELLASTAFPKGRLLELSEDMEAIGQAANRTIKRALREERDRKAAAAAAGGDGSSEGMDTDDDSADDQSINGDAAANESDPLEDVADCMGMAKYFRVAGSLKGNDYMPLIDALNEYSETCSSAFTLLLTDGETSVLELDGSGASFFAAAGVLIHTLYEFKANIGTGYQDAVDQVKLRSKALMLLWELVTSRAASAAATAAPLTQQATAAYIVGGTSRKSAPPPAVHGRTHISVKII